MYVAVKKVLFAVVYTSLTFSCGWLFVVPAHAADVEFFVNEHANLVAEANDAIAQHDYSHAENVYGQLLQRRPDDLDILRSLAALYVQ